MVLKNKWIAAASLLAFTLSAVPVELIAANTRKKEHLSDDLSDGTGFRLAVRQRNREVTRVAEQER